MITAKNKKLAIVLILYTIIIFLAWALCETWLKSHLPIARMEWFREVVLKTIIWVTPALLLIHTFSNQLDISLKDMLTNRVRWMHYAPTFALFTIYLVASGIIVKGEIEVSPQFSLLALVVVMSIAIGEELVFRGWLLNATLKLFGGKNQWFAVLLNALMFLCIHFPLWLYEGTFLITFTNMNFVAIFMLSVIFSLSFIKSRSIWPPITLHVYWNLLMILFI